MENESNRGLKTADPDDLRQSIAFALTHDGRKRFGRGDALMASIVAEHIIRHLEQSNYVIMQGPEARLHSNAELPLPNS